MKILPSVMAKNQKDVDALLKKLHGVAPGLHLDVADGKFVPNTSLWFKFKVSSKFKYNVHLMINNPMQWIEKYSSKVETIIFHPEPLKDVSAVIQKVKTKKKKVGLALKPETSVASIKKYLPDLDYVLILTVHPGFYGAKFLKSPLKKIAKIRKINPKVKIIIDGGMKPDTIGYAKSADYFVSGSFVTKAENPKKAVKELEKALL